MRIREALMKGAEILSKAEISGSNFDSEMLMLYTLKKERIFLIAEPAYVLSSAEELFFFGLINERALGKPVSYITGEKEFMGIPFQVNENVLIPRPDTEILVERAIEMLKQKRTLQILDLCTGSGAIAVSLAYYLPKARVVGIDVSRAALAVADENAERNGVTGRINFEWGDVLEWETMTGQLKKTGVFDLITANPPYIRNEVIPGLMRDVKDFEPMLALDGGADGLDFYRIIIPKSAQLLETGGLLMVEIGYDQGEAVTTLAESCGLYRDVRIIKDLAGLDRVLEAVKI